MKKRSLVIVVQVGLVEKDTGDYIIYEDDRDGSGKDTIRTPEVPHP